MSSSARAMYLGGVQLPGSSSAYNGLDADRQYRSTVRPSSGSTPGARAHDYPISSSATRLADAYRPGSLTAKAGISTTAANPYLSSPLPHGTAQPYNYMSPAGYTPSFSTTTRDAYTYSVSAPAGRSTSVPRAASYTTTQASTQPGIAHQRTPLQPYPPSAAAFTTSASRASGTNNLAGNQPSMAAGGSILDSMRHAAGSATAMRPIATTTSAGSSTLASKPSAPRSTLTSGFTYSTTSTAAAATSSSSQGSIRLMRPPQVADNQYGNGLSGSGSMRSVTDARLPQTGETFRLPTHGSLPRPPVLSNRTSATHMGSTHSAGGMPITIPSTTAQLAAPGPATSTYSIPADAAAHPSTALYSMSGVVDAHVQYPSSSTPTYQQHAPEPLSREERNYYLGNVTNSGHHHPHQVAQSAEPSPSASSTISAFLRPSHNDADGSPRVSGTRSTGLQSMDTTSPLVSPARPSAKHVQATHQLSSTSPRASHVHSSALAEPEPRQQYQAPAPTASYQSDASGRVVGSRQSSITQVATSAMQASVVQDPAGGRLSAGSGSSGSAHLARCASNSSADSHHSGSGLAAPAARSRRRMVDGSHSRPVSGQGTLQSCRTQPDEVLQCSAVSEQVSSVVLQLRHQARKLRQLAAGTGCVGLQNLGNTCFMNSILQVLNAVPEVVAWAHADVSCKSKATFAPAYINLVRSMWKSGKGAVSPSSFLNALGRADNRWGDGSQQDAQEFLHSLLEGLRSDCNQVQGKPAYKELGGKGSESAQAVEAEEYARSWHDSVVDDVFGGLLQSTLQCQECHRQSYNYEPFLDLSLPLPTAPRGGSISIESCLQAFVEEERMQGSESVRCESCKRCCPHTKKLQIWRPPYTLVLTLKRFAQRGTGSSLFSRFRSTSKNSAAVELELDSLAISSYCNPSGLRSQADVCLQRPVYQLVGISHHAGSLEGGHYTASARSAADGQWYHFNDSSVRREAEPADASSSAYVLVYRLVRSGRGKQEQ